MQRNVFLSGCCMAGLMAACGGPSPDAPAPEAAQANSQAIGESQRKQDAVQDKTQICQSTLDMKELEGFLHPTEPGRKPLAVLRNSVVSESLKLTKFGEPVRFVSTDETARGIPYFEFTSLDIRDGSATVTFQYRVEGIRGKAELRREGGWKVTSHEIVEQ